MPPTASTITLDLIRHGGAGRPDGFINWPEAPLATWGLHNVDQLTERLIREGRRYDQIYASLLPRALGTGRRVQKAYQDERSVSIPLKPDQRLVELEHPAWDNRRETEVLTPAVIAQMRAQGPDYASPKGESLRKVSARMAGWLRQEVTDNPHWRQGKPIRLLVSSHNDALCCLMQGILGLDWSLVASMKLAYASLSTFTFRDGIWSMECINDRGHLR